MTNKYLIPDDPSFQEHKGDPFHYGRKKTREPGAGKETPGYKKQRSKSYRIYGLGNPLSIGLQSPVRKEIKPGSYEILVPKTTKKGTKYIAVPKKSTLREPVQYKKGFNELVPALNYVNNITGSHIDHSMYKHQGATLAFETVLAGSKVSISISHSVRRKSMMKYIVKIQQTPQDI